MRLCSGKVMPEARRKRRADHTTLGLDKALSQNLYILDMLLTHIP